MAEGKFDLKLVPEYNGTTSRPKMIHHRWLHLPTGFTDEVRVRNIDPVPSSPASAQNRYRLGDPVWVKPPCYRCTSKFQEGTVTEVISPQTVIVDGVPRHVKDVRHRTNVIPSGGTDDETSDDTGYITTPGRQAAQNGETSEPPLRRSTRGRLPTRPCLCCDQGSGGCVENISDAVGVTSLRQYCRTRWRTRVRTRRGERRERQRKINGWIRRKDY